MREEYFSTLAHVISITTSILLGEIMSQVDSRLKNDEENEKLNQLMAFAKVITKKLVNTIKSTPSRDKNKYWATEVT